MARNDPASRSEIVKYLPMLVAIAALFFVQFPVETRQISSGDSSAVAKARNWIGSADARAAVKSIEVVGVQTLSSGPVYPYHFKMLWPDKHLMEYPGGITQVVNGPNAWSIPAPLMPGPAVSSERRHYDLNLHAIEFLLTPPPQSRIAMTAKGSGSVQGLSGMLLDVVGPEPFALTLVVDPGDGHLVGYTRAMQRVGATQGPSEDTEVVLLEDYRLVRGVKFPFKIVRSAYGISNTLIVEALRVNEGVSAADFVRR